MPSAPKPPHHGRTVRPARRTAIGLGRRSFLSLLAGGVAFTACGTARVDAPTTTQATDPSLRFLSPLFAADGPAVLRSGLEQRMVWSVRDHEGVPLTRLVDAGDLTIENESGDVVAEVATQRFGDGLPREHLTARHSFDEPGLYTAVLDFADGEPLRRTFVVGSPEDVRLVQVGEWAIPIHTPTIDDPQGVEPICTRNPVCPFHDFGLADALDDGPVALLVSTPAFCQTAVCGPVLELLIEAAADRPAMTFVHAEVYENAVELGDPLAATLAPVVSTYGMDFEPSLVVFDGDSVVTERLDFVFDRAELAAALDTV